MLCYQTTKNKTCNFFKSLFTAIVSIISEQPLYGGRSCIHLNANDLLENGPSKHHENIYQNLRHLDNIVFGMLFVCIRMILYEKKVPIPPYKDMNMFVCNARYC